ncbi:MAG: cyclic lactone autoinducer peptide [Lachnospiraceae bacterium]|nr:cyclic lactone autoinducer peptide [Lachnospiraceae bacterium]
MEKILLELCLFTIIVASIVPNACRTNWYQPNEPEGFENL